jgi:hypothetical protein
MSTVDWVLGGLAVGVTIIAFGLLTLAYLISRGRR